MSRSFRTSLMLCAWSAILLGTLTLRADITGSISGIVIDPSGAVVPGVTVNVTRKETGIRSSTVTEGAGFYSLPTLAIVHYDLSVSHPGFDNFLERGIVINANSAVRVDVKLILGSVKNTVVVNSDTLMVETQSTQMGEVIGAEKIESVPLFQRS